MSIHTNYTISHHPSAWDSVSGASGLAGRHIQVPCKDDTFNWCWWLLSAIANFHLDQGWCHAPVLSHRTRTRSGVYNTEMLGVEQRVINICLWAGAHIEVTKSDWHNEGWMTYQVITPCRTAVVSRRQVGGRSLKLKWVYWHVFIIPLLPDHSHQTPWYHVCPCPCVLYQGTCFQVVPKIISVFLNVMWTVWGTNWGTESYYDMLSTGLLIEYVQRMPCKIQ